MILIDGRLPQLRKNQLRADLTLQRLIFQIERKMTTFIIGNHIRVVTTHEEKYFFTEELNIRLRLYKLEVI